MQGILDKRLIESGQNLIQNSFPSCLFNKIIHMIMMLFLFLENWMINSGIQKKLIKIKLKLKYSKTGDDVDLLS